MSTEEKGMKHDDEKNRLDLLSTRWINGVGQVLTYGAKKYAAHNWRKGIERSRLLGAAFRHLFAYLGGEDRDSETGFLHLYHASCCLMFASELHETRPDLDDRYGMTQAGPPWPEVKAGTLMKLCEHGCVAPAANKTIPGSWISVLSAEPDGTEKSILAFEPFDQGNLNRKAGEVGTLGDFK